MELLALTLSTSGFWKCMVVAAISGTLFTTY